MSANTEIYKAIAARERASRIEAERLLEAKSRELYAKKNELEESAHGLSEANSLLNEIMEVAPNGIILCTADYVIRQANSTCIRKLKVPIGDIVGQPLSRFFEGIDSHLDATSDGEFFLENVTAKPSAAGNFAAEIRGFSGIIGADRKFLIFFHDISRRLAREEQNKQTLQQMDEASRLEAIGALSAGIAHEINTPIQFIGDNLDFLRDALAKIKLSYENYDGLLSTVKGDDQYPTVTEKIDAYNNSLKLTSLISEIGAALGESRDGIRQVRDIVLLMKEFSHPGSGDKDDVDINKIIENTVRFSQNRAKGIAEITFDKTLDLPQIQCRRGQIQQVILNIVMNAIDAVDEARPKDGRILIRTNSDGYFVTVSISDNGAGVPQELKDRIFNPFFTTKPVGKGTGQGLAIAKDIIVKGHNGRLRLADLDGYSTTFLIELPLTDTLSENFSEHNDVFAA